ncbi:hypothetical protein Poli38472_005534 [Pythium oligandrum]|uniref:Uncharacterized protein n=1 Tax=Pythium oligandrum TaxID=41045 RepID=A0A8K1CG65_PYTOL|nr:hypothetical protein Poli38472_005534 [Pythium oligandrum]|eukprot:TMW62916.1 hypothetical protein Poli38472_005534 [Pythium oligandrum]
MMSSSVIMEQEELGSYLNLGFLDDEAFEKVTCRYVYGDGVAVSLTYAKEAHEDAQSDQFVWPAAPALCEYLEQHRELIPNGTVVELGAGCGLAGLAVAQLQPTATVVFTDQDPGVLKTIEHNCTQQERPQATCVTQRLRWGPDGAEEIVALEERLSKQPQSVDLIVGTDVIYARGVVQPLFWTVDRLLTKQPGASFLMCSSDRYDDTTEAEIDAQCQAFGLERKVLLCHLHEQGTRIQRFTRV